MSAFEERLRQHRHWRDSSTDLHHCSCSTTDISWDDWDEWVGHVVAHVTEDRAAERPDTLLVTRKSLRAAYRVADGVEDRVLTDAMFDALRQAAGSEG